MVFHLKIRQIRKTTASRRLTMLAFLAAFWLMVPAKPDDPARRGQALVEKLQAAAQETKKKEARTLIGAARALVEQGADVNAKGEQGRTALHWIAIGAFRWSDRSVLEEYRELAEILIDKNADVNAEDDYGNTVLDWEEANPEESLRHVLEQAGARRGISHDDANRMVDYINGLRALAARKDFRGLTAALNADVPAGTEIWVRLTEPFHSKNTRTGERVKAVVIAPVREGARVLLEPGTTVEGTVLTARHARDRFTRAEAALDFTNFRHSDGKVTRLATRVLEVDNARETVSHGRILGIPFPNRAVGRWTLGLRGLGFVMPGVSEGLQWATRGYNLTLGREIDYPAGVELILRVSVPEKLQTRKPQKDWNQVKPTPAMVNLVRSQPLRVKTPSGEDSDITNLLFVGTAEDLEAGFQEAGWLEAKSLGVKSGFRTALAALRQKGYEEAPFSKLLLDGKEPDYEYQKDLNTVAKRHHLRIYRRPGDYQGKPVWIASATHDIGIGMGRAGTKWYHLIDPEIDKERQKIADDLLFTGVATGYSLVDRPEAPRKAGNATGDELRTDGHMMVLYLTGESKPKRERLAPAGGL
jgi:hypothetical protein